MPIAKDFVVKLRVHGKCLQEFDVCTPKPTQGLGPPVECWVPSQEGKNFSVFVKNNSLEVSVTCIVWMDGCLVRQFGCEPTKSARAHGAYTRAGRRRFQFANVGSEPKAETGEEGEVPRPGEEIVHMADGVPGLSELGTIEVHLYRCVILRKNLPHRAKQVQLDAIVPGASMDGTHRVVLNHEAKPRKPTRTKIQNLDSRGRPYAKVRFKYRPLATLQARGIAPPPPTVKQDMMVESTTISEHDDPVGVIDVDTIESHDGRGRESSSVPFMWPKQEPDEELTVVGESSTAGEPQTQVDEYEQDVKPSLYDFGMPATQDMKESDIEAQIQALQEKLARRKARGGTSTPAATAATPVKAEPFEPGVPKKKKPRHARVKKEKT